MNAVLFKSEERFSSFKETIGSHGIQCTVLDFEGHQWIDFDYRKIDFVVFFPSFKYSSNYPLALHEVYDNLLHLSDTYPHLKIFPDPKIIRFYNDKYKQYLFLNSRNYPTPPTLPLFSHSSVDLADRELGYPMVVKNRYGAGGGSVFKVVNKKELAAYYRLSTFDFFNVGSLKHFVSLLSKKIFYYQLIKRKKMAYPFLSPPLLAQKYIRMDRDLKTVVGNYEVVEAHWRIQASQDQWKVNIDGGGIGEWSKVPSAALSLSEKLARDLQATWLNIDLIPSEGGFLISEFSPVWHHYAYKEKPTFIYKDDYNIRTPLETSLNLEKLIVESLIASAKTFGSPT